MNIPEFDECAKAVDAGTASPIEMFVYENDLSPEHMSLKFREELRQMLLYVSREAVKSYHATNANMFH